MARRVNVASTVSIVAVKMALWWCSQSTGLIVKDYEPSRVMRARQGSSNEGMGCKINQEMSHFDTTRQLDCIGRGNGNDNVR